MPPFDLAKTVELGALFKTPPEQRGDEWRARFLVAVPDATLVSSSSKIERASDSFPYFQLAMPDPGPLTPFCITHILDDCLDNGLGVVVFADEARSANPEWIFSYGDLLSYSLFGEFYVAPESPSTGAGNGGQLLVGSPSEAMYPARARKVLGDLLRNVYHHPAPKLGLIDSPSLTPTRNLVVNFEVHEHFDGNLESLTAAMGQVNWFIPSHIGLMALPHGIEDSGFADL